MKEVFDFLRDLGSNNNREWFLQNKPRYLKIKDKTDSLASNLIGLVSEVDSRASVLSVKDCTYRIYRDTRFSNDKTPYKTHIGIFINPPLGKKGETLGYYFHLEPDASMIICGTAWLPPALLKQVRQSIVDEIDEYREIVENPEFKKLFPTLGFDKLKTAPKGFDKNWEYLDYIKPRTFGAQADIPDSFFDSEGLAERVRPYIRQSYLYNRFINYTIESLLGLD